MAIDISEREFESQVVERSKEVPVVVDFWAEWCGPCRQLGPLLEQEEAARAGDVVLAKVDVDANPAISRQFGIQGIPAVKAFKDGKVVSEFVGAQPPQAVKRFFDGLVPSEAERLAEADDEPSLRRALELEPSNGSAAVKLARLLAGRGDTDEALALVDPLAGNFAAQGLAARLRLLQTGDPGIQAAFEALDRGETEQALDALLGAISATQDGAREDLRRVYVAILDQLGVEDPTARDYRRRLATALY